jgi:hypothetical protein
MLYKMEQYISNSLTQVFEPAIGQRAKYTANTTSAAISTANTALDGSGAMATVITGASNGTHVETISIKATGSVSRGMIRLFLSDGELSTKLIAEIDVPEKTVSSVDEAFEITLETDFMLKSGLMIAASTNNAESFIVRAEGLDLTYP